MADLIEAPVADTTHAVAVSRIGRARRTLPSLSGKLLTGVLLIVGITLFGLIGPLFTGDPRDAGNEPLLPPSPEHLLGTTKLGHDVLAQIATGTQGSLFVGVVAGLVALLLALLFGVLAGYFGGLLDELLMLATNIMLVIPGLPLVMIIAAYVQNTEGLGALARSSLLVAVVLGITGWAGSAVVLRGTARSLRTRDYVAAAVVAGERPLRVIFVEILPNLVPLLAAQLIFGVIFAVLGEAGLSYLGLGPTGSITLGTVLNDAQTGQAVGSGAWWWFVPPGAIIALIGTGLSLINFAIDEIVNPKLRLAPAAARRQRRARRAGVGVTGEETAS
ncbi:ABC transporter permease [Microbacterium sp. NPDC058342]|uniref:ABC transporter permease n=1 Tax=Microbacterium sp. NPDC058342 TaxID=3346454 RepID=UPI0036685BA1